MPLPSQATTHSSISVRFFAKKALNAVRQFPELFEIVPLGGTAEDPDPVDGNPRELTFIVRLKNIRREWTPRQQEATENLIEAYLSNDFTAILEQHGLTRP